MPGRLHLHETPFKDGAKPADPNDVATAIMRSRGRPVMTIRSLTADEIEALRHRIEHLDTSRREKKRLRDIIR